MSDWIFFGRDEGYMEVSLVIELTIALRDINNARLIACAAEHITWMESEPQT